MGFIILWIACAFIGGKIGGKKGQGGTGFILGLLFGPVGCLMILAMSGDTVDCPHCRSKISQKQQLAPNVQKILVVMTILLTSMLIILIFFPLRNGRIYFLRRIRKIKN